MTMTQLDAEVIESPTADRFSERINRLVSPYMRQFDRLVRRHVLYHLIFLAAATIEVGALLLLFTVLAESSTLAISLSLLFLTLFSYFILRLYLRMRLPEQLCQLRDSYLDACRRLIGSQDGITEHHLMLAKACCRMASALRDREYHYYRPPATLEMLASTMETFSCWWHWSHVHAFTDLMLQASIDEHIKLVKCEPTNLEVHAALANAYVMLSSLYADPRKGEALDGERWLSPERWSEQMRTKFRETAARAIEEFKILNHYAPNDPWVHAQLAYSYHDLQMPEEEIREYETILRLRGDDRETLFKLGMLYFQQGHNAEGLRIYEELKTQNFKRAEELIAFYGAYQPHAELAEV